MTRWDRRTDQGDQEGISSGGTSGISEITLGAGWALVSAGGSAGEEVGDLGDRAWISLKQGGRLPSSLGSHLTRLSACLPRVGRRRGRDRIYDRLVL